MCSIEQGFNLTTHKVAILPPHKLRKAKKNSNDSTKSVQRDERGLRTPAAANRAESIAA
jgi:hypothetical protein